MAVEPAVEGQEDLAHPADPETPVEAVGSQIAGNLGAVVLRTLLFHVP